MWTTAFRVPAVSMATAAALTLVLYSPVRAAAPAADAPEAQSATWVPKQLNFVYQGFTTRYSCDGLRDKVRTALLRLGARRHDLLVRELGCSASAGVPDRFPGVSIKMFVLQPAAAGTDAATLVPAHWKPVNLKLDNSAVADAGECELVEQIAQKLLPLFATRNVDVKTACVPHQLRATGPLLRAEVLTPDESTKGAPRAR